MRSKSLVAAVLLAVALGAACATSASAAGPRYGIKGGLSIAGVRHDADAMVELSSKLGFGGGGSVRFPVSESFYVQPELLYVLKGFSYGESEGTDASGNVTGTFETLVAADYVQIPVLFGFGGSGGGKFRRSFYAGPEIGFEVRERFVTTGSTDVSTSSDQLKSTDYGLCAGLGLAWKAGAGSWDLDIRYDQGLAQLSQSGTELRSWGVLVMAGFTFSAGD